MRRSAWGNHRHAVRGGEVGVVIRPLTAADRGRYVRAFAALSPDARYLRFGLPKPSLSDSEVDRFTTPDGYHHVAFAALSAREDEIVGVGRYFRSQTTADIAITVADAWRHQGIGTLLLGALTECAQKTGVRTMRVETLAENRHAAHGLQQAGFDCVLCQAGARVFERRLQEPRAPGAPRSSN
jgi:GNAT superfamily N-acetyltransferase